MRTCNYRGFGLILMCSVELLWLSIIGSPHASAEIYHVGKAGKDSNSCATAQSRSTAKLTIAEGLTCLRTGDTLYIGSGTYAEGIDSDSDIVPSGTSWSNVVTIAAYPGEVVTLKPSGTYAVIGLADRRIQYVVFDGLTLDAAGVTNDGLKLTNGTHHIRFQNGEVKNAPRQGILVTPGPGGTEYNEFRKVKIHDNGRGRLDHGIYISTSYNLIEYSEIYRNAGYGVHMFDVVSGVNKNVVRFNTAHNNSIFACCSAGILVGSGDGNTAYGNISYENQRGITVGYQNATGTRVYNNTIYNNRDDGIHIINTSSDAFIFNNIVYGNLTAIRDDGKRTRLEKNLTTDPQFTNPAARDFSLRSGSPAIDAGIPVEVGTLDFRGLVRPQGRAVDVGAYEYSAIDEGGLVPPAAPQGLMIIAPQ